MLPFFAANMCGSTAWLAKKTAFAFTSITKSQLSSVTSRTDPNQLTPALFTSTSMRPYSDIAFAAIASRSDRDVTSTWTGNAWRPSAWISSATCSAFESSTSATTMSDPSDASSNAMDRPMPRPAPVTIDACPSSSMSALLAGQYRRTPRRYSLW